eukprot:TRINITY_DN12020_c0_g1_i1.p1 TRINITY_DN12020_c0_g1~~TRINITY_DN12020_c0_g1_i1.p1  ORF type:complete len:292 (+),score=75.82 TRINITY_DN12020_c0_g1_i1:80-877(+)
MAARCCLVIGAGSGIGSAVARRFAREGYTACLVRRSDRAKLEALANEIEGSGGKARVYQLDATDEKQVTEMVSDIEHNVGPIEVLVYNLGANVGHRTLKNTPARTFELAWRLGAFGGFLAARAVGPRMAERKRGTIIFTGATAGVRGNHGQHAHASGMFSRRALSQTIAHELGRSGVHVAHVIVDGPVDSPDTLGKHFPEAFNAMKAVRSKTDSIMLPESIAENYWMIHQQPRNAWTQELDLRPWTDAPWYCTSQMPLTQSPAKM